MQNTFGDNCRKFVRSCARVCMHTVLIIAESSSSSSAPSAPLYLRSAEFIETDETLSYASRHPHSQLTHSRACRLILWPTQLL